MLSRHSKKIRHKVLSNISIKNKEDLFKKDSINRVIFIWGVLMIKKAITKPDQKNV